MMMIPIRSVAFLISVLCFPPGAAYATPPSPQGKGVVFMVGGIGGWDILGKSARTAFAKAGLPHELRTFQWTHGRGRWHKDLLDAVHVDRKACELAEEIRLFRRRHPNAPIFIVAKSGGAGLALRAVELLPGRSVDRLVLLAAAVSPTYDLRPALRATRHELVSYASRRDQFILNWGTRSFGAIDRVYGPSAGLHGFTVPDDLTPADQLLYDRLVQIHWMPQMILRGHAGGHTGTSCPRFLRKEIARWLDES